MSFDTLEEIAGSDVTNIIVALNLGDGHASALRSIVHQSFDRCPEELFGSRRVRKACYDAMTADKQQELASRLGVGDWSKVETLDPAANDGVWHRYLGFFGISANRTTQVHIDSAEISVRSRVGLFAHQRHAVERVWGAIGEGFGRVVLHMPTGAGKTRTAMHIVSRVLNMNEPSVVVWLAASSELLDQASSAFEELWSALGNRDVTLLRFWGNHSPEVEDVHDGIVIAGFQKMYAYFGREPLSLLRLAAKAKLVVVDEAHQAIAPTYSAVITKLAETGTHNALLGLTATPGRTWSDVEADKELSEFFGERKVMLEVEDGWDDPVSYLIGKGYLAKPTFRQLDYEPSPKLKETLQAVPYDHVDYGDEVLATLAQDVERNVAIITEIERLAESGRRRILHFASSVRHAEMIAAVLGALGLDARVVTGTTHPQMRRLIIRDFRSTTETPIVLCNYGVLTTGFDAPGTSAAVIARPTRSLVLFSQMVGRATRGPRAGGNETCDITTIVDIDLPGFGDIAEAFKNWEDVWNEQD